MGWIISKALYENWHCSQERGGESSEDICLDGEQSVPLSGSHTQLAYLSQDKMTEFFRLSRFGMTFKPLTESRGEDLLTWYREDFLAKTYPQPEREQELPESAVVCGKSLPGLLARFDPASHTLKTAQCSLFEDLIECSAILPRWGMMLGGACYPLPIVVLRMRGKESGFWPTPTCNMVSGGANHNSPQVLAGKHGINLAGAVKKWPTPTAHNAKETNAPSESERNTPTLAAQAGGALNADWVEWLMAWPIGWTDLKPLETDRFQLWQQQHSKY